MGIATAATRPSAYGCGSTPSPRVRALFQGQLCFLPSTEANAGAMIAEKFYMDLHEEIRFRVTNINFTRVTKTAKGTSLVGSSATGAAVD